MKHTCSHEAALLFKLKAACRLGYTNPSRTYHYLAGGTRASRQRYDFNICEETAGLLIRMISFQVTPAELIDIEFYQAKAQENPEHQDDTSCQPRE